ncbi:hypothetical protein CgunFtcFv8_025361 [Champsocephalus gunnari]|uniref:Uncharacterized protein n=1 Tax=Champsocephalus gunnari TaxID=52237 RepID=A0AAN8H5L9_CHAGU|nr:hypothetical protein CgunFtcFv8_025361 [Champsocephalus gunnari]
MRLKSSTAALITTYTERVDDATGTRSLYGALRKTGGEAPHGEADTLKLSDMSSERLTLKCTNSNSDTSP